MAWQQLVFANLFGFVDREDGRRRFRQGVVFVPRGSGKTSVAAPLAPYLSFLDGEGGAEDYAAAVARDQARTLFDTAREMVRRSPEIRRRYGVAALANAIWHETTSSNFRPVSSDAKALDGLDVQVAVCDEIASHRTSEVYDVLLTGPRHHGSGQEQRRAGERGHDAPPERLDRRRRGAVQPPSLARAREARAAA